MQIIKIDFNSPLNLSVDGKQVLLHFFKTEDLGIIKIGIEAAKSINVNREEIYKIKLEKSGKAQ